MEIGRARFDAQIEVIYTMLNQAKSQDNPALWLFENDLRTPMFRLEGLARLYAQAHNRSLFLKIKDKTKEVEDALGWIDYYSSFYHEFASNKKVSVLVKQYFEKKLFDALKSLNKLLKKEDWLNGKRLDKISSKLKEANWKQEEREVELFNEIYKEEVNEIDEFLKDIKFHFDNMEEDVHEFRRKLRWLSIYPQALKGLVKLVPKNPVPKELKVYHTPEVVGSPYNKLVASKSLQYHLTFDKNNFLALSWLIAELGIVKDKGLKIEALVRAYQKAEKISKDEAYLKTYSILGKSYPSLNDLLQHVSVLSQKFLSQNILQQLIKE